MPKQDKLLDISQLKAAVFDWDNTLAESRTPLTYAVNQILPRYGLPEWEISKQKRDINLSFRDNFPRIFGDKAHEAYEQYVEVYLQNVDKMIKAYPKTTEVLEFLKDRGVSLMIMSNKDRRLLEHELPLLFDETLFDKIVCGHEAEKDKPYRDHLIWTLKDFMPAEEITPQNVWVIGDSPQDSLCACGANAQAIRIGPRLQEAEPIHSGNVLFYDSFVDFYENLLLSNAK